jgi:outer membrane lipoprotein-sorting protein
MKRQTDKTKTACRLMMMMLLLFLLFINLSVAAAQVPITKPVQKHIYDIQTVQAH